MKVAIVGSRSYPTLDEVAAYVQGLDAGTEVITGGAPGVDTVAEEEADKRGLDVLVIYPDYDKWAHHRERAPLERNTEIVATCDRVVAFQSKCEKGCSPSRCPASGWSHGTQDTIKKAIRAGKRVSIKRPNEPWREA